MNRAELLKKIERFEHQRDEHLNNNRPVSAGLVHKTVKALKTHLEDGSTTIKA